MDQQVKIVSRIALFLIVWAIVCAILAYGKPWIGNKQEMYPSFLYPAFLRNPIKTSNYLYPLYYIEVHSEDSIFFIEPKMFFNQHWLNKMDQILNKEEFVPLKISELGKEWNGYKKIYLIREIKKYNGYLSKYNQETESKKSILYASE